MRDPARIERVIDKLRRLWLVNPDWRLGQLVLNVARPWAMWPDVFNMEDSQFEDWLDDEIADSSAATKGR